MLNYHQYILSTNIYLDSNLEVIENKIKTTHLTNNSIGENTIEKILHQNRNTTDSVFNTSYDFLQVNSHIQVLKFKICIIS